jgi:DNA-binding LacI/PurR family transcriptional regulator
MIFGGEHDQYQERYTSYEDALEGHKIALNLVNKQ